MAPNTLQVSNNQTVLKDRVLWHDGDSSYSANNIYPAILSSKHQVFVDNITKDIEQYNKLVDPSKQIKVKNSCRTLSLDWTIPQQYKELNVRDYVIDRLGDELNSNNWSKEEVLNRANRVAKELKLYENYNFIGILQVLIYIINTLNHNSVVWGVGRGSSVSSYVLYLIGVHDVDSVKYNLDIKDFLH